VEAGGARRGAGRPVRKDRGLGTHRKRVWLLPRSESKPATRGAGTKKGTCRGHMVWSHAPVDPRMKGQKKKELSKSQQKTNRKSRGKKRIQKNAAIITTAQAWPSKQTHRNAPGSGKGKNKWEHPGKKPSSIQTCRKDTGTR